MTNEKKNTSFEEVSEMLDRLHTLTESEITRFNSLSNRDKVRAFFELAYSKREGLVGEDIKNLDFFLSHFDVDFSTSAPSEEHDIIFFTIGTFSPSVLQLLVDKGVSLDVTLADGTTPLEFAKLQLKAQQEFGRQPESHMIRCSNQILDILSGRPVGVK
jgi:hypothetical protein